MAERRHIRVSEAQDGRNERPARRYGVTPSRIGRVEGQESLAARPAQRSKIFLIAHTVAARPARAIDRVSGMCFGHTATQFWALPHC
jgi:hypothetical protein